MTGETERIARLVEETPLALKLPDSRTAAAIFMAGAESARTAIVAIIRNSGDLSHDEAPDGAAK